MPRGARRIDETGNSPWQGLVYQTDIPLIGVAMSGDAAWQKTVELGTTHLDPDDDNDGILDENHNWPLAANPGQEDHDPEDIWDVSTVPMIRDQGTSRRFDRPVVAPERAGRKAAVPKARRFPNRWMKLA